jgi:hypothetical protein
MRAEPFLSGQIPGTIEVKLALNRVNEDLKTLSNGQFLPGPSCSTGSFDPIV